jgi:hypothetical protein
MAKKYKIKMNIKIMKKHYQNINNLSNKNKVIQFLLRIKKISFHLISKKHFLIVDKPLNRIQPLTDIDRVSPINKIKH